MKIVLLRPNYDSHLITPPLGIGYLSSYLKSKGSDVKIIDGLNRNLSEDEILHECNNADIIGISILSAYLPESISIAKKLKLLKKIVVIGGPYVSAMGKGSLLETNADYAILGEGEISFYELIEAISIGKDIDNMPGVLSLKTNHFVSRNFIDNLDTLPFPDWQEMDPRFYKKAPHGGLIKNFPVAPIISTRGCPCECTFCASPKLWDRKIRFRSPENTVNEIEYLVNKFNVKEIHFEDDNLTLKKEHIAGICGLILKKNIKISWATPNGVRADTLNEEIVKLMKKSGCYFLAFGIESANSVILRNIKKNTNIDIISTAINLARKNGIMTQGFFIFGLPGETKESIKETISFAKKSGLDRAQFLLLDVLPGSYLWDRIQSSRCIDLKAAKSYQDVTWLPDGLNKQILFEAQSKAFKEFFLRPKQIFNIIKYFKLSQLPFVLERLIDYRIIK